MFVTELGTPTKQSRWKIVGKLEQRMQLLVNSYKKRNICVRDFCEETNLLHQRSPERRHQASQKRRFEKLNLQLHLLRSLKSWMSRKSVNWLLLLLFESRIWSTPWKFKNYLEARNIEIKIIQKYRHFRLLLVYHLHLLPPPLVHRREKRSKVQSKR